MSSHNNSQVGNRTSATLRTFGFSRAVWSVPPSASALRQCSGPFVLITFQDGQALMASSLVGAGRAAHTPGHTSLQGIKAQAFGTDAKGNTAGARVGRLSWAALDQDRGENWTLSSAHKSSSPCLFCLKVPKEPTKRGRVLQTLEAEAHPQPWETCLLEAFLCCDQQAREMQQVRTNAAGVL